MSPCIHYLLMTLRSTESQEGGKWFGVGGAGVVPGLPAHLRPTFSEQLFGDTFLVKRKFPWRPNGRRQAVDRSIF